MNPRKKTIGLLEESGFIFKRAGANHDVYFNSMTRMTIPVKRHDFDEDDMRYILKEAGLIRENRKGRQHDLHVHGAF